MFSKFFNALVHATDEVGGHEVHVEFVVVFVVALPEGVVLLNFGGDEGPEVFDGFVLVVVGVESFPRVHVQGKLGHISPGVGGLGFLGGFGSGGGMR